MRNKFAMIAAAALLAAGQAAATGYSIDSLTARYGEGYAWSFVNNAGELAGRGPDGTLELRLRSGSVTYRDDTGPYGLTTQAFGNDGTVYFHGFTANEYHWSAVRTPDGAITGVPALRPGEPYAATVDDVNDSGIAVGSATAFFPRAVMFKDGKAIDLGTRTGESGATGINNHGVIVGYYADSAGIINESFIYTDGKITSIGRDYIAKEVNDANLVAGDRFIDNDVPGTGNYQNAFLWQDGVTSTISLAGKRYSRMIDLNNSGVLLGAAWNWDAPEAFFLYTNGETVLLDDILAAEGYAGWSILGASDINDNGQIVALAYSDASGVRVTQQLLLTPTLPVPEPGTWAMLLAGLGCLGMVKRRAATA